MKARLFTISAFLVSIALLALLMPGGAVPTVAQSQPATPVPSTPALTELVSSQPDPLHDPAVAQVAIVAAERTLPALSDDEPTGLDWKQRLPASHPSALTSHAMAYDSARGVVVLFGGYNGSNRLDNTWEWDGTDWMKCTPTNHPSARVAPAMAYDSARGVVVLFGGYCYRDDTWEYGLSLPLRWVYLPLALRNYP